MKLKKIMAWLIASTMAMSAIAVAAAAEDEGAADGAEDGVSDDAGDEAGDGEGAGDGYVAAITFQTTSYMFRNTFGQADCLKWDDDIGGAVKIDGSSTVDAEITGNGIYLVELNGVEDNGWNMLKVETSIPSADFPDINMEIKHLILDGKEVTFDAEAAAMSTTTMRSDDYCDSEFTVVEGVRVQIINGYDNLAAVENKGYKSIKVVFEITGMGYDAEGLPEINVDDLTYEESGDDNNGDNSGDNNGGDNNGSGDSTEGTTTTPAPSSSNGGDSNMGLIIGIIAAVVVVIVIIVIVVVKKKK